MHYYKHKPEGRGERQERDRESERERVRWEVLEEKYSLGCKVFHFMTGPSLCWLAAQVIRESRLQLQFADNPHPQSSSALASAVAACRCRCHHVHCISLSTWHPACNFLVVKLCFAFVFVFVFSFAFTFTCTEIINKTSELLARWCVLGYSCSCSLGFSFGFVCGFASVWPKWAKAKQKLK